MPTDYAVTATLDDHVQVQGCFFHLYQSTCCKIHELGLVQEYADDDDVRTFCARIDSLAFLPTSRRSGGAPAGQHPTG